MRTFFGLEPDAQTKLAIENWRDKALPGLAGAVPAANFHITLAFLGNIASADLESLANIQLSPFQLDLSAREVGYFSKPGIGFLNVTATPQLLALREELLLQIPVRLRKKDKSTFVPHITLFRNLKMPLPSPLLEPVFDFSFAQFHLYESIQVSQKRAYKPVFTYC